MRDTINHNNVILHNICAHHGNRYHELILLIQLGSKHCREVCPQVNKQLAYY